MIPKIIHQCYFPSGGIDKWVSMADTVLARYEKQCVIYSNTWKSLHPDYEYYLWTYDTIDRVIPRNDVERKALAYVKSDLSFTLKSDMFRLLVSVIYGGIYADTDMEAKKNFDPLLDTTCFCAREREGGHFASSLMGNIPDNTILIEALEKMVWTFETWPDTREKNAECLLGCGFYLTSKFLEKFETIHPIHYFFPYFCTEMSRENEEFTDCYTVHHWHGMKDEGWTKMFPIDYTR